MDKEESFDDIDEEIDEVELDIEEFTTDEIIDDVVPQTIIDEPPIQDIPDDIYIDKLTGARRKKLNADGCPIGWKYDKTLGRCVPE